MKAWIIGWTLLAGAAGAQTLPPEALFRQGVSSYQDEKYQEGLDLFIAAKSNLTETTTIDEGLIHYNIGVGHYRLSQPEEAGKAFQQVLRSTEIDLQGKAYFNLGNAQYQIAQQALNDGDVGTAFKGFQAAQTNFMQALRIVSDDRDAKVNVELSIAAQIQILQMVAMAMSRLQQGEQMVEQYRFVDANRLFQEQLPMVQKALELEPDKKKLFETMAERTTGVAGIIEEPQPAGGP